MIKQPCAPSFGCDPEVFVMNTEGNIVPCVGYLPGTKKEPYHPDWVEDPELYLQEDNVMCEFNIGPQTDAYIGSEVSVVQRAPYGHQGTEEARPDSSMEEG